MSILEIIYWIYIACLGLSAVMALVYSRSLREKGIDILSIYLPLVLIQEVILYLAETANNAVVYNIYRVVTALVFAYIYYRIPFMARYRKAIGTMIILYVSFAFINYIAIESLFKTSSYMQLLRGFVMTAIAIMFLIGYFNLDKRDVEKYWLPILWITIGLVCFYPVVSIAVAFQKYLAGTDGIKLYQLIPRLMSIFLYGCFSYAFYLCKKTNSNSLG